MPTTAYPGLHPFDYTRAYGGIPQVPDPSSTQGGAIAGNLAQADSLQQLLRSYNPSYDTQSGIVGQELAGELPADVVSLMGRQGAERGVLTGSPGSANNNAALLAALGLTSLGQQKQGMKDAGDLAQQSYNFLSPMMVSPDQAQQAALLASIYASAPVPADAAAAAEAAARRGFNFGAGSFPGFNYSPPGGQGGGFGADALGQTPSTTRFNPYGAVPVAGGATGPFIEPQPYTPMFGNTRGGGPITITDPAMRPYGEAFPGEGGPEDYNSGLDPFGWMNYGITDPAMSGGYDDTGYQDVTDPFGWADESYFGD